MPSPAEFSQQLMREQNQGPKGPDLSELEALKARQVKQAQDFRTNQKGMQSEQDRASRMTARQELAKNLYDVRSTANTRGLLYSGLKQQGDVQAQQGAQSLIANDSAANAARLEDQARGLEDQAAQTGISLQAQKQGIADNTYATALANRQARDQVIGAGLGAIGSLAGGGLARR